MIRSHATSQECRAVVKIVQQALRRGELVKPSACSWCGVEGNVQAHHPDYDRPLMVVWICAPCHRAHHRAYSMERRLFQ